MLRYRSARGLCRPLGSLCHPSGAKCRCAPHSLFSATEGSQMTGLALSDRDIALLAVLVAAVVGFLNYQYTRSKVRFATQPQLRISLEVTPRLDVMARLSRDPQPESFRVKLQLKNLSTQASVSDVHYVVQIAVRRRLLPLWKKPRSYGVNNLPSLDPLQEISLELDRFGRSMPDLTTFIHDEFYPDVILNLGERHKREELPTYALVSSKPLRLAFIVRFTPGVFQAGRRQTELIYRLQPIPGEWAIILDRDLDERIVELLPPARRELRKRLKRARLTATFNVPIELLRGWVVSPDR